MCHTIPSLKFFKVIVDKQNKKYVPAHSMWLNRVFADLANTDEWHYLTIDCSCVKKNSPGRYRTQADDPEKQVCYFNKLYNVFTSNRIKKYIKVDQVQGKEKTFDAEKTLKQDGIHNRFSKPDTNSEPTDVKKTTTTTTTKYSNTKVKTQNLLTNVS